MSIPAHILWPPLFFKKLKLKQFAFISLLSKYFIPHWNSPSPSCVTCKMSDKTLCMQRDTFAVRVQHNKTTYDDVARRSALTAQLGVSALCMVLNEESSFLRAPVPVDSRRVPLKSSAAVLHLHLCDFFTRFAVPNRKQKYCHDENVHYKHRPDAQGTIRQRGYGAAGEATIWFSTLSSSVAALELALSPR